MCRILSSSETSTVSGVREGDSEQKMSFEIRRGERSEVGYLRSPAFVRVTAIVRCRPSLSLPSFDTFGRVLE